VKIGDAQIEGFFKRFREFTSERNDARRAQKINELIDETHPEK
jgi:hypothetical protein